ncbi:uncharacterized protein [Procambarus clarkii]|uniref:uncharacterized protein n=1 Tax=Procambarus clarkii TaxID=6728 RepID=UPI0037423130
MVACKHRLQGLLLKSSLLLLLNTSTADKVAESLNDGFGYFYKISGYALNVSSDYKLIHVSSRCECLRRCQVVPACSSVSVVSSASAGSVNLECRVSNSPAPLTNPAYRPKLYRTPGALHFLFTKLPYWDEVDHKGFGFIEGFWLDLHLMYGCTKAVITTLEQMMFIMRTTTRNRQFLVNLSPDKSGIPTWDFGGANIRYNQTQLDPSRIINLQQYFFLYHNGSNYFFKGVSSLSFGYALCQTNPLNLV